MNGIHDMGGMTGFGPVMRETDEPVFHTEWERCVFAMNMAVLAFLGPVDRFRHAIERMDPLEYLATSYYEHWLAAIEGVAKELGYLSDTEIEAGRAVTHSEMPHPPLDAATLEGLTRTGVPATREDGRTPVFDVGETVRARNLNPASHTRLPRYVRGRTGVIAAVYGNHVFPDTVAHDRGEAPQPLYNVSFAAAELWGDDAPANDRVHIDLWEDYLEPVSRG